MCRAVIIMRMWDVGSIIWNPRGVPHGVAKALAIPRARSSHEERVASETCCFQLHKFVARVFAMSFCRYKSFYETVVRADLLSKFQYKNVHQIPKIKQVAISGATHAALGKHLDHPVASAFFLELITGQQAKLTRIRRGNARYKVREGFLEGSKVTLHGAQMYNFLDRLVTMVLPRQTDFQGLRHDSFDGQGNYAIGVRDVNLFLEVEAQHGNMLNFPLDSARGVGVYIQTTAETDLEAKMLLSALRFPFAPEQKPAATAAGASADASTGGGAS